MGSFYGESIKNGCGTQTRGEVWFHANGRTEVEIEAVVVRMRDRSAFLPRGVLRVTKNKGNPKPLRGCLIAVDKLPDGAITGDQLLLKGRTFFLLLHATLLSLIVGGGFGVTD